MCVAPEVHVELRGAGVERAAETVVPYQPFGMGAGHDVADRFAKLGDGSSPVALPPPVP